MTDNQEMLFGFLFVLGVLTFGLEAYFSTEVRPWLMKLGLPVFRATYNLLRPPVRFPDGHSLFRDGTLFSFPSAGTIYALAVGGHQYEPMRIKGAAVKCTGTILPGRRLRVVVLAPVSLPVVLLIFSFGFFFGRTGNGPADLLYSIAVPLGLLAAFVFFYRYRARHLGEQLVRVIGDESLVPKPEDEVRWNLDDDATPTIEVPTSESGHEIHRRSRSMVLLPVMALFYFGSMSVYDAMYPYGLEQIEAEGSLVTNGSVLKTGSRIDRKITGRVKRYQVWYRFEAEGITYKGMTECDCRLLEGLRVAGDIPVRYVVEDPTRNIAALPAFDPETYVRSFYLGWVLIALSGGVALYHFRTARKTTQRKGRMKRR